MTDIISKGAESAGPKTGVPDDEVISSSSDGGIGGFSDAALIDGMELLFFAYRDFIAEPDAILAEYGFGRAHHRVIHFVGRNPGITVSELLAILKITKQSLSRVLGQLVREKFIHQDQDRGDRRKRPLTLTQAGRDLERRVSQDQRIRIARAYREAGPDAVAGFRQVLLDMINPGDRSRVDRAR
jgi:DNA-binding MarR family transcriptional regulator